MAMTDAERSRLDLAARAGWLYFIGGNTQEEIARKLKVSRPTAQRLVSLALSERLITFRLEHPIAACMQLAKELTERFKLVLCDVVPADPASTSNVVGVAEAAAVVLERQLREAKAAIIALGTGRTLRAAVDQLPRVNCPDHRLVSLVGNISHDGAASFYDVLTRLADLTHAPHYPMLLPVIAKSEKERDHFIDLGPIRHVRALAAKADLTLIGIGQVDKDAPLYVDGFLTKRELDEVIKLGAVCDLTGWLFDAQGRPVHSAINDRVTSVAREPARDRPVVGVAMGGQKIAAIHAALKGRLINGLITNESTARAVLAKAAK